MTIQAVEPMAKKRGRKPVSGSTRDAVIAVKCRQEYKDWLVGFADHKRVTPSSLLDIALLELAKADGYEPPPKR